MGRYRGIPRNVQIFMLYELSIKYMSKIFQTSSISKMAFRDLFKCFGACKILYTSSLFKLAVWENQKKDLVIIQASEKFFWALKHSLNQDSMRHHTHDVPPGSLNTLQLQTTCCFSNSKCFFLFSQLKKMSSHRSSLNSNVTKIWCHCVKFEPFLFQIKVTFYIFQQFWNSFLKDISSSSFIIESYCTFVHRNWFSLILEVGPKQFETLFRCTRL